MIATLLILGGAVFGALGGLHAVYTLLDLRTPRRLAPVDPSVAHAMANSALLLSGGRKDMWRADGCRSRALDWAAIQYASGRHHYSSADPDWLRLFGSRAALLVSCSCHRRCHWHWLLRRRMDSVTTLTREGSGNRSARPLGRP